MSVPRLSVILLSLDGGASVKRVVQVIRKDSCAGDLEIVLAIDPDVPLGIEPPSGFAGFCVVRIPVRDLGMGEARAAAIRQATAPYVVFGEEHCFPEQGWAAGLLKAFEGGAAAIGPRIGVANPKTSVSWNDAILCYGDFLVGRRDRAATHVPWHNSAYRRDALLSCGDRLGFLLLADSTVQVELARQGHRFEMTPDAAVLHCNHSLAWPQLRALFCGSRLYGATRTIDEHWTFARKLLHAVALPASIGIRMSRALHVRRALRAASIEDGSQVSLLVLGCVTAAAGEVWGYLFGIGPNTVRERAFYELQRVNYVVAEERALFDA